MAIPFICPHCGLQTSVSDEYTGQSGPCVGCGKTVAVLPNTGEPAPAGIKSSEVKHVLRAFLIAALLIGGFIGFVVLALFSIEPSSQSAQRSICHNRMKQIALALLNYESQYGCFPPAVITDKTGRPMHSWRVAILPYLEEKPLYERYNFKEPWESPSNLALVDQMPLVFHCAADRKAPPSDTNYVMIVGPGTVGGVPGEGTRLEDIKDGPSNTILLVEVVGAGIKWTEPRDLNLNELTYLINDKTGRGISSRHRGGATVVMADGYTCFLSEDLGPETLRCLILRNDSEPLGKY